MKDARRIKCVEGTPISRILSRKEVSPFAWMIISLGSELPRTSSDLPEDLDRASRRAAVPSGARYLSSYLALHQATLTVPVMSPPPRWALTPPFHPYLSRSDQMGSHRFGHRRFDFCGAGVDYSAWELPSALPMESGLSSRRRSPERPSSLPPTPIQYKGRGLVATRRPT